MLQIKCSFSLNFLPYKIPSVLFSQLSVFESAANPLLIMIPYLSGKNNELSPLFYKDFKKFSFLNQQFSYAFAFSGSCARIIAANIKIQPTISLRLIVWFKSSQPASTEKTLSRLKIKEAIVGSIPLCPMICSV